VDSVAEKVQGSTIAVDCSSPSEPSVRRIRRNQRGHSKHLAVTIDLNQPGRLRVGHWLTLHAVSHSKLYELRRRGEIPPADGNDGRPFWNTSTARSVLNH